MEGAPDDQVESSGCDCEDVVTDKSTLTEASTSGEANSVVGNTRTTSKPGNLDISQDKASSRDSPKTPSSLYTKSVIGGVTDSGKFPHNIQCFVLSFWDNIVGPRTAHVWKTDKDVYVSRSMLQCIATRSLGGELSHGSHHANIDLKVLLLKKLNTIVYSYVFEALGGILHSLSVVIPEDKNREILQLLDMIQNAMHTLVGKLRILLAKEADLETALMLFASELYQFLQFLTSMKTSQVSEKITLQQTYLHPDRDCSRSFVQRSITAHLLTGGHSLVVSPSPAQANMMIHTLSMFLSDKERSQCRLTSDCDNWSYQPDLLVQGCVQQPSDQPPKALDLLDLGDFPSAVIVMETQQVSFTGFIHQHIVNRHAARQKELAQFWAAQASPSGQAPKVELLSPPESEHIIPDLFNELDLLPPGDDLVEGYVRNFMLVLNKRAFALLVFLDEITNRGKSPSYTCSRKKIRSDLGYGDAPVDFKLVLAAAEKMRPGVCGFLYRDRVKTYVNEYGFSTGKRAGDNDGLNPND